MKNLISRLSNWQHWPFIPFYFPIFPAWLWYCVKSRSIWFFSASNPTLTFGGFEGESKKEMYRQLSKGYYPHSIYMCPQIPFDEVIDVLNNNYFSYPFIVKPNVGMAGILFRKIDNEQQLKIYHQHIPIEYVVQNFINFPLEISVFYYRYPENKSGHITGFFSKELPVLKGDGFSSIKELLQKNNQANIKDEISKLPPESLEQILKKGEIFNLSFIGNRYHGATFHDLSSSIDNELLALFDIISLSNNFYYGRYDIKCVSVEDLKKGKNFSIIEFNGAGSIPNHVFTEKFNLIEAYKEITKHWKVLYEISRYNHKAGLPYWGFLKGYRFLKKAKQHFKVLKECDKKII